MKSLDELTYLDDLFKPKLSKKNKEKIKKLQKLKTSNGFSVAIGMLLKATSKDYLPIEEIQKKYYSYQRKFSSKYLAIPMLDASGALNIEKCLEKFVEHDYIDKTHYKGIPLYNLTFKGKQILPTYIRDKELMNLFN